MLRQGQVQRHGRVVVSCLDRDAEMWEAQSASPWKTVGCTENQSSSLRVLEIGQLDVPVRNTRNDPTKLKPISLV